MSLRLWIWIISALCALSGAGGRAAAQTPADPRAAVAILFQIESDDLKERLRDDLPKIAAAMDHALRRSLARLGFLNSSALADREICTILFRLVQASTRPHDFNLEVSAQGPGVDSERSVSLLFEQFLARKDWTPNVVAQDWAKRIDDIISNQQAKLVSDVLGLPPLNAEVKFYPNQLRANVLVSPDRIHASSHQTPKFRVRVIIREPGPPLETVGEAEFTLGGCNLALNDTYVCDIEGLAYKGRPPSPAAEQQDLMKRPEISIRFQSLHVLEYWPDAIQRGSTMIARVGAQ